MFLSLYPFIFNDNFCFEIGVINFISPLKGQRSSGVEQLIRNQQVRGSIPLAGS